MVYIKFGDCYTIRQTVKLNLMTTKYSGYMVLHSGKVWGIDESSVIRQISSYLLADLLIHQTFSLYGTIESLLWVFYAY